MPGQIVVLMVTALIEGKGKYLVLKRSERNLTSKGKWQFPEGKVRFGEDLLKALKREVEEETNLVVIDAKLIGIHSSLLKEAHGVFRLFRTIFKCKVIGKIKLSAEKVGTFVLGGDYNSNSANDFSLSVVSLEKVKKNKMLTRNGASPGDYIGVTGELGRFNAGYFYYHEGVRNQDVYRKMLVQDPRLKEGKLLGNSRKVNSCTDIPDGLIRCLKFVTKGAIIYDEKIPLSKEAKEIAQKRVMKPYQIASIPAGDLELIFTVRPENKSKIDNIFNRENLELSWIGRITDDNSIKVIGPDYEEVAKNIGYVRGHGNMLFASGRDVRREAMKRYGD